ncbi:MAG: ABC transporter ATP-binding protein [Alphaproteobacteria bacterium]|nr:ABC transporter ATP-binding protein [Alphaproteobacteria bacterium]
MSLVFENVSKRFGALSAITDVSMRFEPGLITSIIGPNGAGKSTLINMAAGSYSVSSGRIALDDRTISGLPKHRIARAGLSRTYQNIRLFDEMTALENLEVALFAEAFPHVAAELLWPPASRALKAARRARCLETLQRFELDGVADEPARSLAYGHQKQLEIARALVTRPRALLLDEPAAGLNHAETDALRRRLEALKRPDLVMIVVEHDMNLVMSLSDRIYVMHQGRLLFAGTPAEVQGNEAVQEAYLGAPGEHDAIQAAAEGRTHRVRLRANADIARHQHRAASG